MLLRSKIREPPVWGSSRSSGNSGSLLLRASVLPKPTPVPWTVSRGSSKAGNHRHLSLRHTSPLLFSGLQQVRRRAFPWSEARKQGRVRVFPLPSGLVLHRSKTTGGVPLAWSGSSFTDRGRVGDGSVREDVSVNPWSVGLSGTRVQDPGRDVRIFGPRPAPGTTTPTPRCLDPRVGAKR